MQGQRTANTRLVCGFKLALHTIQKCQVGACLVTPAPHRLVAMGYNGMPDGRGFKDDKMDWGTEQSKYSKKGPAIALCSKLLFQFVMQS